jgi:hypothetical protein
VHDHPTAVLNDGVKAFGLPALVKKIRTPFSSPISIICDASG